jgi:hypothetical protein
LAESSGALFLTDELWWRPTATAAMLLLLLPYPSLLLLLSWGKRVEGKVSEWRREGEQRTRALGKVLFIGRPWPWLGRTVDGEGRVERTVIAAQR